MPCPAACRALVAWLGERRGRVAALALLVALFYLVGWFATPVVTPGLWRIYG